MLRFRRVRGCSDRDAGSSPRPSRIRESARDAERQKRPPRRTPLPTRSGQATLRRSQPIASAVIPRPNSRCDGNSGNMPTPLLRCNATVNGRVPHHLAGTLSQAGNRVASTATGFPVPACWSIEGRGWETESDEPAQSHGELLSQGLPGGVVARKRWTGSLAAAARPAAITRASQWTRSATSDACPT